MSVIRSPEAREFFADGPHFDFFQAVKVLEALVRVERLEEDEPDVVPVGSHTNPNQEGVSFRSRSAMHFPASDIQRIDTQPRDRDTRLRGTKRENETPVMEVNFLTLCGTRGPLPDYFAELIRDRARLGDNALKAFLDIINHRLISLLYRIRQRHRPTLNTGRVEEHPFANYLLALAGLGGPEARSAVDEGKSGEGEGLYARELIFYSGLFWHRQRPMVGLERLLSHYFGMPIRGEQLTGGWLRLHADERSRLSTGPGAHNKLGASTVAGSRVPDPLSGYDIVLGPLDWDAYLDFLPIGGRFGTLSELARLYTRGAFDMHLRVELNRSAWRANQPTLSSDPKSGVRLGWSSWLVYEQSFDPKPGEEGVVDEIRFGGHPYDPTPG